MATPVYDNASDRLLNRFGWSRDAANEYRNGRRHGELIRCQGRDVAGFMGWVHLNAEDRPLGHSRYGLELEEHLKTLP